MAPSYSGEGREKSHYQLVTDERLVTDIAEMVLDVIADDALLYLWAPNAIVLEGTPVTVAKAWGFTPVQLIPWIKTTKDGEKPRFGGGHFTRVCSEQLVLCKRGRPEILDHSIPGVILAPRRGHSEKPDAQYELVEKLGPGPYLELFARKRRKGWTSWGNEVGVTL
jgi:N6-adenosine-specific RNA methylase IME4